MSGRADRSLVLDASVGIPLIRDEALSADVDARVHEAKQAGLRLLAPSLFWLEVMNVLGRRYQLQPDAVLEAMVELEAAGIETVDLDRPMLLLAMDAMARFGLTAYDAAYLALAEAADADLLTADALLARAAGERAQLVGPRRIGEARARYSGPEWTSWPGAAAYLRELRSRLQTATPADEGTDPTIQVAREGGRRYRGALRRLANSS